MEKSKWPSINKFGKFNTKNYLGTLALIAILYLVLYLPIASEGIFSYTGGVYINVLIAILFAVSLNIVVGLMGQLSLGHAGFIAAGAYAASVSSHIIDAIAPNMVDSLQLIIASLIGGVIASIFGILVAIPILRLRGDYLAIITLAFGEIIKYIIQNIDFKFNIAGKEINVLGGAAGLKNIPQLSSFSLVFFIVVISIIIMVMVMTGRQGRLILSVRENEIAAENIGININKVKVYGFALAAFFAGVGGSLFAHNAGIITPDKFGFIFSIEILVMVVLGGLGSITGSVLAAIFLTYLNEILRQFSEYRYLVYAVILILLMIFRPTGIFGTSEFTYGKFKNFLQKKKRIK